MSKQQIKSLIENKITQDGMLQAGIAGVQYFRVTQPIRCAPAIYEPSVVAIVSGAKETILDGKKFTYGSDRYMCCPMSVPVETGTHAATPETPLIGVYISLDTRVMTELAIQFQRIPTINKKCTDSAGQSSILLARWDDAFSEALLRLIQLDNCAEDMVLLGEGRLRELYFAIFKGEAGEAARRVFGVANEIARAIEYLGSRLSESVTIEEMASNAGMSRAVFHRKFKQATSMSPMQFVKSMRLNHAALKISEGQHVNEAAREVGYRSSSQFSREFKRMFGHPPKQWAHSGHVERSI